MCLATPLETSCLSFFIRKLCTLNCTIHDAYDSTSHCLMWHETKEAGAGIQIASAFIKWAEDAMPGSNIQQSRELVLIA